MKKIFEVLIVSIFCIIIFIVPIFTIIPKIIDEKNIVEYSFFENRAMAQPPTLTKEALFSGKYFSDLSKCFDDQLWNRDFFIEKYTDFTINVLKRPVVNNVIVQGELLLPFHYYSENKFDKDTKKAEEGLKRLSDSATKAGSKLVFVGIPEQSSIFRDKYPERFNNNSDYINQSRDAYFEILRENNIEILDMGEIFAELPYEEYYSLTDHHFNLKGAFVTYNAMIDLVTEDVPRLSESDITFKEFENVFYGSRNRKIYNAIDSSEKLMYYEIEKVVEYTRENNGEMGQTRVFTMPQDATTPVTYDVYMGGDMGETVIRTNREELPNVLIFGDSFTNPIETFLYHSFNEMRSLDFRHYDEMTITEYIETYKPDYIFYVRDDLSYFLDNPNGNLE